MAYMSISRYQYLQSKHLGTMRHLLHLIWYILRLSNILTFRLSVTWIWWVSWVRSLQWAWFYIHCTLFSMLTIYSLHSGCRSHDSDEWVEWDHSSELDFTFTALYFQCGSSVAYIPAVGHMTLMSKITPVSFIFNSLDFIFSMDHL